MPAARGTSAKPRPIGEREFARAIARFAPFESSPHLAVAVSGGADSLALCLLAHRWAQARGGHVTALTVDHGLRPESKTEAREVGLNLRRLGIDQVILRWRGRKPTTGLAAAAREARYALLDGWCRKHHVLHLLLGHHRRDQAETVVMRAGAASGFDGLAGMAAQVEASSHRRLRPLLDVPPERLRATLRHLGIAWVEDPSNRDPRYTRARLRPRLGDPSDWTRAARRIGAIRAQDEHATAKLLAAVAEPHPAGFCRLDRRRLVMAPRALVQRVLARVLLSIGGGRYPPRRSSLERLSAEGLSWPSRGPLTLAGCRLIVGKRHVLVVREARGFRSPVSLDGDTPVQWDGRFEVTRAGDAHGLRVAGLGRAVPLADGGLPGPVAFGLPALFRGRRLVAPWQWSSGRMATPKIRVNARFAPVRALLEAPFAVA